MKIKIRPEVIAVVLLILLACNQPPPKPLSSHMVKIGIYQKYELIYHPIARNDLNIIFADGSNLIAIQGDVQSELDMLNAGDTITVIGYYYYNGQVARYEIAKVNKEVPDGKP